MGRFGAFTVSSIILVSAVRSVVVERSALNPHLGAEVVYRHGFVRG